MLKSKAFIFVHFILFLALIHVAYCSYNNRNGYYDNSFQDGQPRKKTLARKAVNLGGVDEYDSQQYYDSTINSKTKTKYYNDQYAQEGYPGDKNRGDIPAGRKPRDIVTTYTSTMTSMLLVSVVSSIAVTLLTSLLAKMLIAVTFPVPVIIALIVATMISCYTKSDFGDFSKSFGVLVLLLAQKLLSALSLAKRSPFPPADNPWKYVPDPTVDNPVEFTMIPTLICLGVSGAYLGLLTAKPIPLFPGWLGALIGGGGCAYFGTLRDGRGDFTRFLGSSTLACLSHTKAAADDVALTAKAMKLWRQVTYYAMKLDKQYAIGRKLKSLFGWLLALISVVVNRVKRDMGGANTSSASSAAESGAGFPVEESLDETNLSYTLEEPADYRKPPPPPPPEYGEDARDMGGAAKGYRRGTRSTSKSYY